MFFVPRWTHLEVIYASFCTFYIFAISTLPIIHFVYPLKILDDHCFKFLLGQMYVPGEIVNNAMFFCFFVFVFLFCFFFLGRGGQTECTCIMEMVNWR